MSFDEAVKTRTAKARAKRIVGPRKPGRPRGDGKPGEQREPCVATGIFLRQSVIDKAKRIGKGELSAGLRTAVGAYDGQSVGERQELDPKVSSTATLTASAVKAAKAIGSGNVSRGLEAAVAAFREQ